MQAIRISICRCGISAWLAKVNYLAALLMPKSVGAEDNH
jgi:hypothetical protein